MPTPENTIYLPRFPENSWYEARPQSIAEQSEHIRVKLRTKLTQVIAKITAAFPIEDYVDESHYYEMYAVLRELGRCLPEFNSKRLLDIGSGPMDKTGIFQLFGFQCYAVDDLGDPWHQRGDNIHRIKAYGQGLGINFFQQQNGVYTIPFDAESFDVVCSLDVIEHLHESPRRMLNTMGTYLKPNGVAVIVMPNSVNFRKRLSVLVGRTNHVPIDQYFHSIGTWRGHVREYTLSETVYICEQAGFDVLSATTFEQLAQTKLRFPLRELYRFVGSIIPETRSGLLVLCRKPEYWTCAEPNPGAYRETLKKSVPKGVA
jgi:SAM-dependent methyltransferase